MTDWAQGVLPESGVPPLLVQATAAMVSNATASRVVRMISWCMEVHSRCRRFFGSGTVGGLAYGPASSLWHGALVRAYASGVAAYDTLFVELADREGIPLATFDELYQNYPTRDVTDYRWRYWGDAFPSLLTVKKSYDPTRLFSYGQSMSPYPADPSITRSTARSLFESDG